MFDRTNKTLICSVVFLDIAEYSTKPVSEQMLLKQRFNAIVAAALEDIAESDRIILDTGDGAAVSFIGDPEDALFVAMSLRDALNADTRGLSSLDVRIGINLGPAKLVKDINDKLNLIGDGINVAQRIMSFAEPGTVLVSRSYYEVVSCLSEEYAQLFHHEGSRTDKHVRDHEVYGVGFISQELMKKKRAPIAKPRLWRSLGRGKQRRNKKPWDKTVLFALPVLVGIGISSGAWYLGRQSATEPVLVTPPPVSPTITTKIPQPAPAPSQVNTAVADAPTPAAQAGEKPTATDALAGREPASAARAESKPVIDNKPQPEKRVAIERKSPTKPKPAPALPQPTAQPTTPEPEVVTPRRPPRDK